MDCIPAWNFAIAWALFTFVLVVSVVFAYKSGQHSGYMRGMRDIVCGRREQS
jgi:hypothetical protein